jgi:multiple sugar transport system permease protein
MKLFTRGAIMVAVVIILVLFMVPYLGMILTSVKPPSEAISTPPTFWPREFRLDSYAVLFTRSALVQSFINSLTAAVLSTVLTLLLAVPAAYGIRRTATAFGGAFSLVALSSRMIPYVALALPFFFLMKGAGLTDNILSVTIAHTAVSLPLALWLLSGFFDSYPLELEESARVDGCSRLGALYRIIVPTAMPGIAVTSLFCFLTSWNEFLFALLLTSVHAVTVPIAIANLKTQFSIEWGSMTSLAVLFSLPIVVVSLFLQKKIIAGMTQGAIKG